MELTKEQAIENHRKMWNWIADQYEMGCQLHIDVIKGTYMNLFYPRTRVLCDCFCCEYAGEGGDDCTYQANCNKCPIKWPSDAEEGMCSKSQIDIFLKSGRNIAGQLYGVLCSDDSYGYYELTKEERVEIARMIANLPENENVP